MSLPLAFHREVREETDAAYGWYEQQRAGLGEEFLAALESCFARIQHDPEMYGTVYRDVRAALVRRFPYVVYYRAEPERIEVLAVQHGSRDPSLWRSRA